MNWMVDTALVRKMDSHVVMREPSCTAITAVSIGSHVKSIQSNVALSSR